MFDYRPIRFIIYGQLALIISVLISVFLQPNGLTANDGISFYGSNKNTALPYVTGLLALTYFTYKTARALPSLPTMRSIKAGLYLLIPFIIAAAVVPYGAGQQFKWVHTVSSIIIFLVQLVLAVWLVFVIFWDSLNALLLAALGTAIASTGLYFQPLTGYLLHSEVIFQLIFTAILVRTLIKTKLAAAPSSLRL